MHIRSASCASRGARRHQRWLIHSASALVVVSLLGVTERAEGQNPPPLPEIMQPGVGHRRLDSLVGDWDVTVRFRFGAAPERTGRATMSSAWILDRRVLRQEYRAESGQVTLQLYGFDNQRGTYYLIKFDNVDTGVLHTEGGVSADGRTITTIGDRVDPMGGKTNAIRIVLALVDQDRFNVEWHVRGADGIEQRMVAMEHTRRTR